MSKAVVRDIRLQLCSCSSNGKEKGAPKVSGAPFMLNRLVDLAWASLHREFHSWSKTIATRFRARVMPGVMPQVK
jgi:hypothetical protein